MVVAMKDAVKSVLFFGSVVVAVLVGVSGPTSQVFLTRGFLSRQ